ncbi:MAG: BON domain-containing protein [Anaerolineae bacterium]|jgi:hypothetical protein
MKRIGPGGKEITGIGTSHVTQLVLQALAQDPRTRDLSIDASYDRGTLTLRGRVPKWHDRDVVEDVVHGLPGIELLINDLDVEQSRREREEELRALQEDEADESTPGTKQPDE